MNTINASLNSTTQLKDTGIVILNYKTITEPTILLSSLKQYYPDIRTIIVDNGSSNRIVQQLTNIANTYKNVTVLPLKNNYGFAKGNNAGIKQLREEGYQYICCSNSDIEIIEKGVLESLKQALIHTKGALAGPKIKKTTGGYHKIKKNRPDSAEIKRLYDYYNHPIRYQIRNFILVNPIAKKYANSISRRIFPKKQVPDLKNSFYVYELHGSFLMMGPIFFKYYKGFDPNTFLYGEERILSEMLSQKKLKAIYVPNAELLHKKGSTRNYVWKDKNKKNSFKYERESFNYCYRKYYSQNICI